MVCRYLRMCVLLLCVAALCDGRAFGVNFWCEECKKYISREDWGCHREKEHHGILVGPKSLCCSKCGKKISMSDYGCHMTKEHSELYVECYYGVQRVKNWS